MPDLHIVSMRPGGFHRGGKRHEGHGVHKTEGFTVEQLREMLAEPDLAMVLGGEKLTEEHIAALHPAKKPAKA